MIKKLKRRFVLIIMSMLGIVFLFIIASINYSNYSYSKTHSSALLQTLIQNNGEAKPINEPTSDAFRFALPRNDFEFDQFVTVKLDDKLNITEVLGFKGEADLSDNWISVIDAVLAESSSSESLDGYCYQLVEIDDGFMLAIIDQRISDAMNRRTLWTSLTIGGLGLLIFFFIAIFLAKILTKPVEEAFEKQKQFISDASHELKTPISVISINADVLENEIGENKYLSYIKMESNRMDYLVNDLLTLARMDSIKNRDYYKVFDLSQVTEGVSLTFESCAYELNKILQIDIQKNIMLYGDSEKIKQLLSILVDNAIKYASDCGMIRVSLEMKNDERHLSVFNTGEGISLSERNKIFERFYRVDASRSKKTGGYGLGLAIAKSIVEQHGGKIWVEGETGKWISFEILF
ncbi:ATP-binding protein [Eubacteriaceae bacterium ES2]|nr:ATP-binding protein [Eubacteriaceae bacterium ES2]